MPLAPAGREGTFPLPRTPPASVLAASRKSQVRRDFGVTLAHVLRSPSIQGHLFSLRLQQEGGKKHLKHMQERFPPEMLPKGKSFLCWTSNEEAEPCFVPKRCS